LSSALVNGLCAPSPSCAVEPALAAKAISVFEPAGSTCLSLIRARSLPDQLPKRPVMQSDGIMLAFHGKTATRLN
jgi:hypothetical protein